MTTTVWVGRPPSGYEARALRELARALSAAGLTCHLLANFMIDGHEIDVVVVTPDGIFLVELKQVWGPVRGAVNGQWTVGSGPTSRPMNAGSHGNPYVQMLVQYRVLTTWLEAHREEFLSESRAKVIHFRPDRRKRLPRPPVKMRSLLAFYPRLPAGSQLDLDWKIEPVGFRDLVRILMEEGTRGVHLQEQEITRIAELLHLDRWDESPAASLVTKRPAIRARIANRPYPVRLVDSVLGRWRNMQLILTQHLIERLADRRDQLQLAVQMVEQH